MTSPGEDLKRLLHPALFAAWALFLTCLLASGQYTTFLRPEFGLLLALALFIAIGFMIAAIRCSNAKEIDISSILRVIALLIPIWYSIAIPGGMLGSQAFKKRFIGKLNRTAWTPKQDLNSFQQTEDQSDIPPRSVKSKSPLNLKPYTPTILDIYNHPENFIGKRVVVTGMILRDEQLKSDFEGRDTVLYRFLVTCCAADALPLPIVLDTVQAGPFTNDQWVKADGSFELRQINGESVPMILAPRISLIDTPDMAYLF